MGSVFNEIEIEWKGRSWHFTPSNRLLRRIEGQLAPSSLTDVIGRMSEGKPPISETAFIVSEFLKAAGASSDVADEDEIYGGIMLDFETNKGRGFVGLCQMIMLAISPSDDAAKKQNAGSAGKQSEADSANTSTEAPSTGG